MDIEITLKKRNRFDKKIGCGSIKRSRKRLYPYLGYYTEKHELMFIVTTKESTRDFYYLYEFADGKFKRLGKSRSPKELEEKFEVDKKIRKQS